MSNTYYAPNAADEGLSDNYGNWTVGTSSDSGAFLEVRITNTSIGRLQAAEALRWLADKIDAFDTNIIATGNFA